MPRKNASLGLQAPTEEQLIVDREIEAATDNELRANLRSKRNSLSPIGRLLDDVLLEIFLLLPQHPLDTGILRVCRQWAQVCLTSFSLWRVDAVIGISSPTPREPARNDVDGTVRELARVAKYRHNQIHTLRLRIPRFCYTDLPFRTEKKLLDDVAPHLMVLFVSDTEATEHDMQNFIDQILNPSFLRLSSLYLGLFPYSGRVGLGDNCTLPLTKLPSSLQTLSLRCLRISEPKAVPSLTRLNLEFCRGITQELLLALLRQTPRLRWLTLERTLTAAAPSPGATGLLHTVLLEQLERLQITEVASSMGALVQRLVFPSSTALEFYIMPSPGERDSSCLADVQPVLNLAERFRPILKANFIVLDNPASLGVDASPIQFRTRSVEVLSGTAESNVCLFSFKLILQIWVDAAVNAIILAMYEALAPHVITRARHLVFYHSWHNAKSLTGLLEVASVGAASLHTIELHLDNGVDWPVVKERFLPALRDVFIASEHEYGKSQALPLMKVRVTEGGSRRWSAALQEMKAGPGGLDGLVDRVEVEVVPTVAIEGENVERKFIRW